MRTIPLGKSGLQVPVVAAGCMRMSRLSPAEAETLFTAIVFITFLKEQLAPQPEQLPPQAV